MKLPETAMALAMSKALRMGAVNERKGFQSMKNSMPDTGKFKHAEPKPNAQEQK